MSFKKFLYSFLIGASFLAIIIVGVFWNNFSEVKGAAFSDELPFGISNPVTNNQFQDGRIRDDKETYLPDRPISRQAFKNYLTALVNHASSYGRAKTGNANWYVIRWNLFNEVISEYKQTFGKKRAPDAYAKFVLDAAEILRRLSPEPEIVLGGGGSKFDTWEGSEDAEFYKAVFKHLATAKPSFSPFDAFESH